MSPSLRIGRAVRGLVPEDAIVEPDGGIHGGRSDSECFEEARAHMQTVADGTALNHQSDQQIDGGAIVGLAFIIEPGLDGQSVGIHHGGRDYAEGRGNRQQSEQHGGGRTDVCEQSECPRNCQAVEDPEDQASHQLSAVHLPDARHDEGQKGGQPWRSPAGDILSFLVHRGIPFSIRRTGSGGGSR